MNKLSLIILISSLVSGCGSMPRERGITGAGIGAATGAVIGALTGLTLVEGIALGATGGALTGIVTDKDDINLGEPVWSSKTGESSNENDRSIVRMIQEDLTKAGYDPGQHDGIMGPDTKSAIMKYQLEHNLLVDGRASPELLAHIQKLYFDSNKLVIE